RSDCLSHPARPAAVRPGAGRPAGADRRPAAVPVPHHQSPGARHRAAGGKDFYMEAVVSMTVARTKRSADPRAATRGAAVRRARAALGDALDEKLDRAGYWPGDAGKDEAARLAVLCRASRHHDAGERLAGATLGELQRWHNAVKRLPLAAVRRAIGLRVRRS